jgi:hypothetical protein
VVVTANGQAAEELQFKSILPLFKERPLLLRFESPSTCSANQEEGNDDEDDEEDDDDDDESTTNASNPGTNNDPKAADAAAATELSRQTSHQKSQQTAPYRRRPDRLETERISDEHMGIVSAMVVTAMVLSYLLAAAAEYAYASNDSASDGAASKGYYASSRSTLSTLSTLTPQCESDAQWARWAMVSTLRASFSIDKRALAVFRVATGVVMALDLVARMQNLPTLHTDLGLLPRDQLIAMDWNRCV